MEVNIRIYIERHLQAKLKSKNEMNIIFHSTCFIMEKGG